MPPSDGDVPHIAAECAGCGFVFDMKFGAECPKCKHNGVRWARLVETQTVLEKDSIEALERLYALEDTRTTP